MFYKIKSFLLCMLLFQINSNLQSMQEMAVMMGAQQGAMLADKMVNKEYTNIGAAISNDQTNLINSTTLFKHDIQLALQQEMNYSSRIFTQAHNKISQNQSHQTEYSKQMREYILKSVSVQQPKQYYLLDGASKLDELFTLGTMYTPHGIIWKNPFSVGNWEYDHTNNSFWQMHNEPLLTTASQSAAEEPQQSSENAIQNSIFTEYFTRKPSYSIQCEITIHQTHYPFFAGIIFNKTRWISGNKDSVTKCRMIGIYGTSNNDIGAYFAEQSDTTKNSTPETMYPLQQIINKKATKISTINPRFLTNSQIKPTIFIIKIINSPKEIKCKVWPKQSKEPPDFVSIKSKQPDLYLYHGIGFISPGAITRFALIRPQSLLFSDTSIQAFSQDVENLTAAKKTNI